MQKLALILLLFPAVAFSSLEVGMGMNSTHSGRVVPSLSGAITGNSWALSAFSSGVQNSYYYHSSYGLSWFAQKKVGDMIGGPVAFGIGIGGMYAERGFQDLDATSESKKNDFAIGPAIRLNWTMAGNFYFNIEGIYGLRNLGSHLYLNFQDVISTSIGVRLW